MLARAAIALVAVTLGAMPVGAAVLENFEGVVLVNRGEGFKKAEGPGPLEASSRVMVQEGTATVLFEGNCRVNLAPGQVLIVQSRSPCAQNGQHVQTQASGTADTTQPTQPTGTQPVGGATAGPGIGTLGVIAGVAVVGGIVAASGALSSSKPASP